MGDHVQGVWVITKKDIVVLLKKKRCAEHRKILQPRRSKQIAMYIVGRGLAFSYDINERMIALGNEAHDQYGRRQAPGQRVPSSLEGRSPSSRGLLLEPSNDSTISGPKFHCGFTSPRIRPSSIASSLLPHHTHKVNPPNRPWHVEILWWRYISQDVTLPSILVCPVQSHIQDYQRSPTIAGPRSQSIFRSPGVRSSVISLSFPPHHTDRYRHAIRTTEASVSLHIPFTCQRVSLCIMFASHAYARPNFMQGLVRLVESNESPAVQPGFLPLACKACV